MYERIQKRTYNNSKLLYKYQKDIIYRKHLVRLQGIKKRQQPKQNNSLKQMHKLFQNYKFDRKKRIKSIASENEKLLDKLLNVQTRTQSVPVYNYKKQKFVNPFRKRIQQNIKRQNQNFGQKLMYLRSDLQYSKVTKSMDKYEKAKNLILKSKRAKIPSLEFQLRYRKPIQINRSVSRNLQNYNERGEKQYRKKDLNQSIDVLL